MLFFFCLKDLLYYFLVNFFSFCMFKELFILLFFWKIVFLGIEFSVDSFLFQCFEVVLLYFHFVSSRNNSNRNCTYFCFSVYNTSFSLVPFCFFSLVSSNLIVMYFYVLMFLMFGVC